ncbi:DUF4198 domain-containing protein [Rhodobacteraceae bacterium D3-12]|nr:DUF4198 domain-containing protein [Rhodobacteraceae bacterium D3-12]
MSVVLFLVLVAQAATAHEFWIEAEKYQVTPVVPVKAGLFNGQSFEGVELAWFERRIAAARWGIGDAGAAFEGRAGERPALQLESGAEGLLRLIYQSQPSEVSYTEWEKFARFVTGVDAGWVLEQHRARGLSEKRIRESYTRYCKALIAVGHGAGADAFSGMEFELVVLDNPYESRPTGGIAVQVYYQGKPRGETQLEVFERAPDGGVVQTKLHTDAQGIVQVPVAAGHRYLLNAVVVRAQDVKDVPWESLWASMTFEVPR